MIITDEELLALLESDDSQGPVFHPVSVYALDAASHQAAKAAGLPAYASLHRTLPDAGWQWEGLFAAGAIALFDPASHAGADYLPQLRELDAEVMPPLDFHAEHLGQVEVVALSVPHDCTDGFLYSYWRRPEAYLDPAMRAGSSSFHLLDNCEAGLERLERDLADGTWLKKYGDLLELAEFDAGYRLVISHQPNTC